MRTAQQLSVKVSNNEFKKSVQWFRHWYLTTNRLDFQINHSFILLCKECLKWCTDLKKVAYFSNIYHHLGPLNLLLSRYKNLSWATIFPTLSVHMQHTWMMCECCKYGSVIIQAIPGHINCFKTAHTRSKCYHTVFTTFSKYINYNTGLICHSSTWSTVCQQDFQCSNPLYTFCYAHQQFQ
jgi:hypothetical protein